MRVRYPAQLPIVVDPATVPWVSHVAQLTTVVQRQEAAAHTPESGACGLCALVHTRAHLETRVGLQQEQARGEVASLLEQTMLMNSERRAVGWPVRDGDRGVSASCPRVAVSAAVGTNALDSPMNPSTSQMGSSTRESSSSAAAAAAVRKAKFVAAESCSRSISCSNAHAAHRLALRELLRLDDLGHGPAVQRVRGVGAEAAPAALREMGQVRARGERLALPTPAAGHAHRGRLSTAAASAAAASAAAATTSRVAARGLLKPDAVARQRVDQPTTVLTATTSRVAARGLLKPDAV
eukprot:CAMPEP_0119468282 /NCGR_PEP_ID=MMETSP1344-20130328/2102_1 /TAXON_ID=236787 /ORGANISM="Florenciella parvula, Strain CCMP2471" /LENGTH=294 /DNA_ID=CAMNT_0007500733 /DNA_START=431 /DNA_END=1313 /DNA_ORIENTATION=+